jgi:decaprenylphospho-beta-D-ribofuranose 2-oxidase
MDIPATQDLDLLSPRRLSKVGGFGMTRFTDGYVIRPATDEQVAEVFQVAKRTGRQVVLRGAGRSYGDAAILAESLVLDTSRRNRLLDWDPGSGLLRCEGGLTVEGLWRHSLDDGFWPPVVSGTMAPTLAGALGMNIHGKNAFRVGTLGEHVESIDVMTASGEVRTLTPIDADFCNVVSSAGLVAAILRLNIRLKPVSGGNLNVLPVSAANWREQFEAFESFQRDADYMVSWVDAFASGRSAGRGLFHAAWHSTRSDPATLRADVQDLPDSVLGFFPKSVVWRVLRRLNNRFGMRLTNTAKHRASALLGDRTEHPQSLVAFSFLLDYVPNWRNAYLPGGFIQYQSFVPSAAAKEVLADQLEMQRAEKLESFLVVLKKHRPDRLPFVFSHAVDGYSLAMDFKVTEANRTRLQNLCDRMSERVLACGGRFYLAKDSVLSPAQFHRSIGSAIDTFREAKSRLDPDGLLTSEQAKRLQLR